MKIDRNELMHIARSMKGAGYDYLVKITAVDYEKSMTAIYFLRDMKSGKDDTLEIELDPRDAWLPTVIDTFPAADWYERELSEMFGIQIRGRIAKRLLLEKWDGTEPPFRKSFKWNSDYKTADGE